MSVSFSAARVDAEPKNVRRRRILVVPSEYPDLRDPLKVNGNWAEEQTRAIAAYYDITVVYPVLIKDRSNHIESLDYHGVRTLIVNYRHVRKTWLSPYVLATWRGLRQVRAEMQPECIHAHGLYPAGFAAVLIGRTLGIPVVITEHWGQLKDRISDGLLYRTVLKFTLRRATRVVAVSRFLATEMRELEPRCNPDVVPNIVSTLFQGAPQVNHYRKSDVAKLLFVGSIRDYRKGLDVLLRAMRVYLDLPNARNCHLKVIGDGGRRAEFEDLAKRLGLHHNCTFLGNRSREEVAAEMAGCDLFVMPSKYETFGVVYAEAMACGKPVVACLGGPAEEIVPSWAGRLVPVNDHVSLAQAMNHVISHLEDYDQARISEYARREFGAEAVVSTIGKVYEQAIMARAAGK